ncbi:hypothetical protein IOC61_08765 [Halomonas sp. KAO]|uniref:hypothetical protein n=1 Tax=Halomonas sp. KAO TaxID=2783858 RepID=UPI00189E0E61|nr:hypothetical protein [Halomonas sp. KAO]MBF7053418.1 hypothetical protein [Halomonas sp. KAO]
MATHQSARPPDTSEGMGLFERFLSVWVALVRIANTTRSRFPAATPAGDATRS